MVKQGGPAQDSLPAWAGDYCGGSTLSVHVQPGAKRDAVVGCHGESLKIALKAPPVDGKANAALTRFVAEALGLPKRAVTLASGQTSREKRLRVEGMGAAAVASRLHPGK